MRSREKDDLLTEFLALANLKDTAFARDLLEEARWDLDAALESYQTMGGHGGGYDSRSKPSASAPMRHSTSQPSGYSSTQGAGSRYGNNPSNKDHHRGDSDRRSRGGGSHRGSQHNRYADDRQDGENDNDDRRRRDNPYAGVSDNPYAGAADNPYAGASDNPYAGVADTDEVDEIDGDMPPRGGIAAYRGGEAAGSSSGSSSGGRGGGRPGLSAVVPHTDKGGAANRMTIAQQRVQQRHARGYSTTGANLGLLKEAKSHVMAEMREEPDSGRHRGSSQSVGAEDSSPAVHFQDTPAATFTFPNFSILPDDFRKFVERSLVESSMLKALEASGHLNWWTPLDIGQKLLPMITVGDGNCLHHAASLAMWGYQDHELTLRKALHTTLRNTRKESSMYRRWRYQQIQANKEMNLVLTPQEWEDEWNSVIGLSSTVPVPSQQQGSLRRERYHSLEEFHVFALAHVLRRPIIIVAESVICDSAGAALAPVPFGGVYLPLESKPADCHKSPLILAYHQSHFSPLLIPENRKKSSTEKEILPLTTSDITLLPLHFIVEPGEKYDWKGKHNIKDMNATQMTQVLQDYLKVTYEPLPAQPEKEQGKGKGSNGKGGKKGIFNPFSKKASSNKKKGSGEVVLCAQLCIKLNEYHHDMIGNYLKDQRTLFDKEMDEEEDRRDQGGPSRYGYSTKGKVAAAGATPAYDAADQAAVTRPAQCTTPGCESYGSSARAGLCSVCHGKRLARKDSGDKKKPMGMAKSLEDLAIGELEAAAAEKPTSVIGKVLEWRRNMIGPGSREMIDTATDVNSLQDQRRNSYYDNEDEGKSKNSRRGTDTGEEVTGSQSATPDQSPRGYNAAKGKSSQRGSSGYNAAPKKRPEESRTDNQYQSGRANSSKNNAGSRNSDNRNPSRHDDRGQSPGYDNINRNNKDNSRYGNTQRGKGRQGGDSQYRSDINKNRYRGDREYSDDGSDYDSQEDRTGSGSDDRSHSSYDGVGSGHQGNRGKYRKDKAPARSDEDRSNPYSSTPYDRVEDGAGGYSAAPKKQGSGTSSGKPPAPSPYSSAPAGKGRVNPYSSEGLDTSVDERQDRNNDKSGRQDRDGKEVRKQPGERSDPQSPSQRSPAGEKFPAATNDPLLRRGNGREPINRNRSMSSPYTSESAPPAHPSHGRPSSQSIGPGNGHVPPRGFPVSGSHPPGSHPRVMSTSSSAESPNAFQRANPGMVVSGRPPPHHQGYGRPPSKSVSTVGSFPHHGAAPTGPPQPRNHSMFGEDAVRLQEDSVPVKPKMSFGLNMKKKGKAALAKGIFAKEEGEDLPSHVTGSKELCKTNGCKSKSIHEGYCQKCMKNSQSSQMHAMNYRIRTMGQHRRYINSIGAGGSQY